MPFLWLFIALLSGYLAALLAYPILTLRGPLRSILIALLMTAVALSPLWVPYTARLLRFFAVVGNVALLVKLYDLHVGSSGARRPDFRTFLRFLPNIHGVVLRRLHREPHPGLRENLRSLGWALARMALAMVPCVWAFRHDWSGTPFLLEHAAKAVTFFLVLIPLSAASTALWRLSGGRAREFMYAPLSAATPAEFWRRYNRPAQQFFHEDIFKRWGGARFPLRVTFATFVLSALVHEYVFAMILGRIQGYQTAFFLLQGLAVLATLRIRPKGWKKWPWRAATFAFNTVTSVLFFASVDGFVPFYSRPLPWPLADW
jgi:hypothetical protein